MEKVRGQGHFPSLCGIKVFGFEFWRELTFGQSSFVYLASR